MSRSFTRFAVLAPEVSRRDADNCNTRYIARLDLTEPPLSAAAAFELSRQAMCQQVGSVSRPGVMVFAVEPVRGLAGQLWLSASAQLRAGIIGRHGQADLFLPFDESLPLRHLAVLVRQEKSGLRVRLVDLKTPIGFCSEENRPLSAIVADGPFAVRAGAYWLFFLPTGTELDWSHPTPWRSATQQRTDLPPSRRPMVTQISAIRGPIHTGTEVMVLPDEKVQGHLVLASSTGQEALLAVGNEALDRGLLLGRYTRCSGHQVLDNEPISRVHALVVRDGGELHLIDCASTNGTYQGQREVRAEPMAPHTTYGLGGKAAMLRWEPSQ